MPQISDTKWTPAPWKAEVSRYGNCQNRCSDGMLFNDMMRDASERAANARLIAAAPDLYEALDNLVDSLVGGKRHDLAAYVGSVEEADQIYAALAKARGEA